VAAVRESAVGRGRAPLAGMELDRMTEAEVVAAVLEALDQRRGGWVATPNVDICRAARHDPHLAAVMAGASLSVPDGMPLIWATRLRGDKLPERITGASLIFSLSEAAAGSGRSVYYLGGLPGVPEQAAAKLGARYPGLIVAGTDSPPFGFDTTADGVAVVRAKLEAAAPDIVFVGLGFPKQEKLITALAPALPRSWFVACGAAIPFAAEALPRAPVWMQHSGLEWAFRLRSEPRRLARRYLIDDLPFAARLLASCALQRLRPHAGAGHAAKHRALRRR
jgi:N-acetylglucosaminyldiphosphoundecaprenol N-acetyl-beta-D-mannosaminyltransferase